MTKVKSFESALNAFIDEVNRYGVVPELARFLQMCPAEHKEEFRELAAVFLAIKMSGASQGSGQLGEQSVRRAVAKTMDEIRARGNLPCTERGKPAGYAVNFRRSDISQDEEERIHHELEKFRRELMEEGSDDDT